MSTIERPVHHVGKREPCAMCGSRVFTFATVRDDSGAVLHYLCTQDYNRVMGEPLCQGCQRPIREVAGGRWEHKESKANGQPHKHDAVTPRVERWYAEQDAKLRAIGAGVASLPRGR